ncbi:unnamed protein product [Absidia cylindrospora]
MSSCFWALLSLPNYEFLYLPTLIMNTTVDRHSIKDLLLGRPFIDLIHPDERLMAKDDFSNFTDLNTLAGAVTRCRLRKLDCIANYNNQDRGNDLDWIVVDVIMYTAAENIVLAFFHCNQGYPACPHALCDHEKETETSGIHRLPSLFQRYHDNHHANSHMSNHQEQSIGTLRAFQLYNNVTRDVAMSWPAKDHLPSHYDNIIDAIQDDFHQAIQQQDQKNHHYNQSHPSSRFQPNTPCTHHTRSTSNLTLERHGLLRFEKILIQYGQLTFAVFKISHPSSRPSSPDNHQSSCSSPTTTSISPSPFSPIINTSPSNINVGHQTRVISHSQHLNNNNDRHHHHHFQYPQPEQVHVPAKRGSPPSLSSSSPKSWRIRPNETKSCESCHTTHSPEWRRGPSGHRTLCNACGLRYSRSLARQEQRATMSPIMSHASIQQKQNRRDFYVDESMPVTEQPSSHLHHSQAPPPLPQQHDHRPKYPGQRRFFNLYP